MKKTALYFFLSLLLIHFSYSQEQESVKFEIFHVDLVPATFLYGGLELAWRIGVQDALDKTYAAQQIADSMFYKLVVLEEKTQDYQKNLQSAFMQALQPTYVDKIVSEIHENQSWMDRYSAIYPEYRDLVALIKKKVTNRADLIQRYINDAAKKTGNEGRLDNKQRNDLHVYVLDELFRLKYISQAAKVMLGVVNPEQSPLTIVFPKD